MAFPPCPPGCRANGGTCDPLRGACACPVTRAGAACERFALPACTIRATALRPTFLIRDWQARLEAHEWLGALTCRCVAQLVALPHLLQLPEPWRAARRSYAARCAVLPDSSEQTVGELLDAPHAAVWRRVAIRFTGRALLQMAHAPPPRNASWFAAAAPAAAPPPGALAAREIAALSPLRGCPRACAHRGACVRGARCRCFAPARRAADGACVEPAARGVDAPFVSPAAATVRQLERCPADCSAHGECDGEGFCRCEGGWFGLDCALSLGRLASEAEARCVLYVHELPPLLRMGTSFEMLFDHALSWRVMRSDARCVSPAHARFFWLMGPTGAVLHAKLKWAQATDAWRRAVAEGQPRHLLLLLSERGPGDVFDAKQLRLGSYGVYDSEINPASPTRQWIALTHNGMADLRLSGVNKGRCLNCFQPGKDIVLPFSPATTDVPPCRTLREKSVWSTASPLSSSPPRREHLFFFAGRIHPDLRHATYLPYYEGPHSPHVRTLILAHAHEEGFLVHNSFQPARAARDARRAAGGLVSVRSGVGRVDLRADGVDLMSRSVFCWVPPGQRYGDARRHILATLLGCIPVFTVPDEDGHHTLQEHPDLRWETMSLSVLQEQLPLLPAILRNVTPAEIERMRGRLACAWRRLWFSSVYGSCLGESIETDAFDALIHVLRTRGTQGEPPPHRAAACGPG
ncbi:hypothetical protein AB1Y20_015955 [Prymnesium parvum]|uniref:EGF-like domain-containing protein n=1 Tax=Prymnesium parvum TaxID=97485 RepID=A0AB34JZE5_PRYPA